MRDRNDVIADIKILLAEATDLTGTPILYFYDSLIILHDSKEIEGDLKRVQQNQRNLKKSCWRSAPNNHQHKFDLVEAEVSRVLGKRLKAIKHYDLSISSASKNRFIQEEAVANELAASFYSDWGKEKFAVVHLKDAYHCYCSLGEHEKAEHLFKLLPNEATARSNLEDDSGRDSAERETIRQGTGSDLKAADVALQKAAAQLHQMTENVPGMIFRYSWRSDGSPYMIYINSKCRDLFEVEPEEVMEDANKLFSNIHSDDIERIMIAAENSAQQLTPFREDYRVTLPKKGLCWHQAFGQPFRNEEGEIIWDGVTIDITHQKAMELQLQDANQQLKKTNAMRDVFLANMSHELRTPLAVILGVNESLQRGFFGTNEKQSEGFEMIQESGTHLLSLIDEVLDMAKIESGAIGINLLDIDINQLCDASLRLIALQAERKNIELIRHVPLNLPVLHTDEKRVHQILVNLLSNAIKFTEDSGKVTLAVDRIDSPNDSSSENIRFSVTDTGIGIDKTNLDRLFDPFVQVENGLNREHGGTGLGLALVKQLTELLYGSVGVNSEPGIGSCFFVDLPVRQEKLSSNSKANVATPDAATQKRVQNAPPAKGDNSSPLILLAEDNDPVAESTARYLKYSNFRIHRVADGEAAVQAALVYSPDIVLMDIQMPRVDGLEAIRRLRANPSFANTTPIIALTGHAMQGDNDLCIAAGADHYLSKPYKMQILVDLIKYCLHSEAVSCDTE